MKRQWNRAAPTASPESVGDYSKPISAPAKIGETLQLLERGIAPIRAGVKLAILLAFLALVVSGVVFVIVLSKLAAP